MSAKAIRLRRTTTTLASQSVAQLPCRSTYAPPGSAFRTCCAHATSCPPSPCSGAARSTDAITFVVQKKHATYDASHDSFGYLTRALESLQTHYIHLNESDVLLWHEGDIDFTDVARLPLPPSVNLRLCLLDCCSGWGPPPGVSSLPYYVPGVYPLEHWSAGYFYMIRFYAITLWQALHGLGYRWVMRMDDDSVIHSPIDYNVFESMRAAGHEYGWRQYARYTPRVCAELRMLRNATPELESIREWDDYCAQHTDLGFYNNWFIASVRWWLTPPVQTLQRRFENSGLIFSRRLNDLVFQSVVVHTLLPPPRRRHFLDFSYEHVTIRNGSALVGGFESGSRDADGQRHAQAFKRKWRAGVVRECVAVETSAEEATPLKTYYVAHHGCPVCEGLPPRPRRVVALPVLSMQAISLVVDASCSKGCTQVEPPRTRGHALAARADRDPRAVQFTAKNSLSTTDYHTLAKFG